jgi:hypothetical protein
LLRGLSGRSRGGAPDAAARPGQHLLYRRHRRNARRDRLCRFCQRQIRPARRCAERELAPKGIHVAHLVIDAGVDTAWVREQIEEREGEAALANLDPWRLMRPESVAEAYWQIYQEPRDAWSFEREIRPFAEKW